MAKLSLPMAELREQFGPHLNTSPPGGWADQGQPDKRVATHCCLGGQQCSINLKVKNNQVISSPATAISPTQSIASTSPRYGGCWSAWSTTLVMDFFLSETAQHANIVLPSALHEEDEGTSTSAEGRVIRIRKNGEFHTPDGKAHFHPTLAARFGISQSQWVALESRRGEATFQACVVKTIRDDTAFLPYHWGGRRSANLLPPATPEEAAAGQKEANS